MALPGAVISNTFLPTPPTTTTLYSPPPSGSCRSGHVVEINKPSTRLRHIKEINELMSISKDKKAAPVTARLAAQTKHVFLGARARWKPRQGNWRRPLCGCQVPLKSNQTWLLSWIRLDTAAVSDFEFDDGQCHGGSVDGRHDFSFRN